MKKRTVIKWSFDLAVSTLFDMLKKKKLAVITRNWVRMENRKLFHYVESHVLNDKGDPDWDRIVRFLPYEWRDKWANDKKTELILTLVSLINELFPEIIHPGWIYENDSSLYSTLIREFRKNNKPDWNNVKDCLPVELQKKWKSQPRKDRSSVILRDARDTLVGILDDNCPDAFNKTWIKDKNSALYKKILRSLERKNGDPDWQGIITLLPKKWQDKWFIGEWNNNRAALLLNEMLVAENPYFFNKYWVGRRNVALYKFISGIKRKNKDSRWEEIISLLSPKWRRKWISSHKRMNTNMKKARIALRNTLYDYKIFVYNEKVIKDMDYNLYLYLLKMAPLPLCKEIDWYQLINLSSRKIKAGWREDGSLEITKGKYSINELAKMASRGSYFATCKLFEELGPVISQLMDVDEKIKKFNINIKFLRKKTLNAIYLYPDNFMERYPGYLRRNSKYI